MPTVDLIPVAVGRTVACSTKPACIELLEIVASLHLENVLAEWM